MLFRPPFANRVANQTCLKPSLFGFQVATHPRFPNSTHTNNKKRKQRCHFHRLKLGVSH